MAALGNPIEVSELVLLLLVLKQVLSGAYSAKQSSAECCLAALLGLVEQRDAGKGLRDAGMCGHGCVK